MLRKVSKPDYSLYASRAVIVALSTILAALRLESVLSRLEVQERVYGFHKLT